MSDRIAIAMQVAYELGRWRGQVDLEEHYENEQFSSSAMEVFHARKMSMPLLPSSKDNQVLITLRSQQWRDGVKEHTMKEMERIQGLLAEVISD